MDHKEVGRMWDENAPVWTEFARKGYDVYRDLVNTPAFMRMLPDVNGLDGLDIGCGEGHNTRLVAERGANMTAIDISETFIRQAVEKERDDPHGITYIKASAIELPFPNEVFDFEMATMSLMDVPEQDKVVAEAYRVLKPGGFLQFSITHPCFWTAGSKWMRNEDGEQMGMLINDYFENKQGIVEEWLFGGAPKELKEKRRKFRIPRFFRTLSGWVNLIADAGFRIEKMDEPFADEETAKKCPRVADTRLVGYFLIVLCRKPI